MRIDILLFAQLREAAGQERLSVEVEEGAKVRDLVGRLMNEPAFSPHKGLPLVYAVNESFEGPERLLADRDRLAILTPMAGG